MEMKRDGCTPLDNIGIKRGQYHQRMSKLKYDRNSKKPRVDLGKENESADLMIKKDQIIAKSKQKRDIVREDSLNVGSNANLDPNEAYRIHLLDIIKDVIFERKCYAILFRSDERELAKAFMDLPVEEQNIVARLHLRKGPWFRLVDVAKYLSSYKNLDPVVGKLKTCGILKLPENRNQVLEAIDCLLTTTEQKRLLVKLGGKTTENANKARLFDSIKRLALKQRTLFGRELPLHTYANQVAKDDTKLLRYTKTKSFAVLFSPNFSELLGRCFALHYLFESERMNSFNSGLLVKFNKLRYAEYKVDITSHIFPTRFNLTLTERSMHIYLRLEEICFLQEKKLSNQFNLKGEINSETFPSILDTTEGISRKIYQLLDKEQDILVYVRLASRFLTEISKANLAVPPVPPFLLKLRPESILCKVISRGVPFLEQAKMYEEAVDLLYQILSEELAYSSSRGKWWNRLSINLKHLKRKEEAILACNHAMNDPALSNHGGHYLEVQKRLTNLSKGDKFKREVSIPVFEINGRPLNCMPGIKSKFASEEDLGVATCSVEKLVIEQFQEKGGWEGLHCESKPFRCLFILLLWDQIFYDRIPHVFQTRYQAGPLDLLHGGPGFFQSREDIIESRLREIESMSAEDLSDEVKHIWKKRRGKIAIGMDWTGINCQTLQCLATCLGQNGVSTILRTMAIDYNHFSAGMPDLWLCRIQKSNSGKFLPVAEVFPSFGVPGNETAEEDMVLEEDLRPRGLKFECMMIEVKGPNDRLSEKQQLWLEALVSKGVNAFVCKIVMQENERNAKTESSQPADDPSRELSEACCTKLETSVESKEDCVIDLT